jgi:hypothetical protein
MKTISPEKAKYVAVVNNVKELRLIGKANLDFWNRQLTDKPFQVFNNEGFAEIVLAATELVWRGFRFNELMMTIRVAEKNDPHQQIGVFLLQAYNSNRFFAFCERLFFSTPYDCGQSGLSEKMPGRMNLDNIFEAKMSEAHRSTSEMDEDWEGAVFLPKNQGEKYFIAKLSGRTEVAAFAESDQIKFAGGSVFDLLKQSDFKGIEWRSRKNAFHAKSKTYRLGKGREKIKVNVS